MPINQSLTPMRSTQPVLCFDQVPANSYGFEGQVIFVGGIATPTFYQKVQGVWTVYLALTGTGGGASLTGANTFTNAAQAIAANTPVLTLNDTSNTNYSGISFAENGQTNWQLFGNNTAVFGLSRFVGGVYQDQPITFANSTGVATFTQRPKFGANQAIDAASFATQSVAGIVKVPANSGLTVDASGNLGGIPAYVSGTPSTVLTGTTAKTALVTFALPALKPHSHLEIYYAVKVNNNANTKSFTPSFGGQDIYTENRANNDWMDGFLHVVNKGATNSQFTSGMVTDTHVGGPNNLTVDTSVSQNFTFYGQLTNAADTLQLLCYAVKIVNPQ